MQLLLNFISLIVFLLAGCSSNPNNESVPKNADFNNSELIDFIDSTKLENLEEDLSVFFSDSQEVAAQNATDGARFERNFKNDQSVAVNGQLVASQEHTESIISENPTLSVFSGSSEELINKDETIESITKLNQELLAEITRLKKSRNREGLSSVTDSTKSTDELESIKAKLIKKTEEINFLKIKNSNLQDRIIKLENIPSQVSLQEPVQNFSYSNSNKNFRDTSPNLKDKLVLRCSLDFDAVVTLQSGKNREALYTEFFLLNQSLFDLLSEEINLSTYSEISSYEELWAQSRKSPYKFPGIFKQIRNLFLSQVSSGQGYRIRTDLNGFGSFKNVRPGLYFLAGTASLGTVGVTWNVPVYLRDGTNKTSLTLSNASWRE